jgi:hypothetical protein
VHVLCCNVAALAVASIYYTYRAYVANQTKRKQVLHERVAYMLWTVAHQMD